MLHLKVNLANHIIKSIGRVNFFFLLNSGPWVGSDQGAWVG